MEKENCDQLVVSVRLMGLSSALIAFSGEVYEVGSLVVVCLQPKRKMEHSKATRTGFVCIDVSLLWNEANVKFCRIENSELRVWSYGLKYRAWKAQS